MMTVSVPRTESRGILVHPKAVHLPSQLGAGSATPMESPVDRVHSAAQFDVVQLGRKNLY
jgi:hypothetical protein